VSACAALDLSAVGRRGEGTEMGISMNNDFDQRMRDAAIEFGSIMFGANWRARLADKAGLPKRILDDHFASDRALPQSVSMCILRLMQDHLDEKNREAQMLAAQIATLRQGASKNASQALSVTGDGVDPETIQPTGRIVRAFAGRSVSPGPRLRLVKAGVDR